MTYDQMEAVARGEDPGPSLAQAATRTSLPFCQCPECKGAGWTNARLALSYEVIGVIARHALIPALPIILDKCGRCDGAGGWIGQ